LFGQYRIVWLNNTIPYSAYYALDDSQYQAAIAWVLGAPQPILSGITRCAANHTIDALGIHLTARNCGGQTAVTDAQGGWGTVRHDILVRTIKHLTDEIGLRSQLEPGSLPGDLTGNHCADLKIFSCPNSTADTLLDVTVSSVYSCNMSLRVPSAGHKLGATALKAETDKE
jgi:hypothetical protein